MPEAPAGSDHASPKKESCEPREIPEEKVAQAEAILPDVRSGVAVVHPQRDGERVPATRGTAWFLNDTYAVTNAHIIQHSPSGKAKLWTTNQNAISAEVVAKSTRLRDVAILKLTDGTPPTTLSTADSTTLCEDDYVMIIGHPGFIGKWVPSIGTYIGRMHEQDPNLEMRIPSTGGNSGSPVFTLDGDVVGMVWGGGPGDPNLGVPTPTSDVVHTEYPYQERIQTTADPIEEIRETLDKADT